MKPLSLFLVVLAVLGARLSAQVDTGRPIGSTPFDRHNSNVRQTYSRCGSGSPSIDDVRRDLRTAYRFRYYFDPAQPYAPQPPEVTESRKQGDCKAKSLWLVSKMGTRSARYSVGRTTSNAKMSHAWVFWPNGGTWLFLDPTNTSEPIQADRVVGKRLFIHYSYSGSSAYVHPSYDQYARE